MANFKWISVGLVPEKSSTYIEAGNTGIFYCAIPLQLRSNCLQGNRLAGYGARIFQTMQWDVPSAYFIA